jgi:Tol biopolymer transport system component
MRRLALTLALCLAVDLQAQAASPRRGITAEDYFNFVFVADPRLSPDGSQVAYVSFPPGTLGHPADRDVIIRLVAPDGGMSRDLVTVFGGQGTMNVPSWAPDSRRLAFVEYPMGA